MYFTIEYSQKNVCFEDKLMSGPIAKRVSYRLPFIIAMSKVSPVDK